MINFVEWLLDCSKWPPRKECGDWSAALVYVTVFSECVIAFCYFSVAVMLCVGGSFVRLQNTMFLRFVFVAIFLTCGVGHLIDAFVFWFPAYNLISSARCVTAIVSIFGFPVAGKFIIDSIIDRASMVGHMEEIKKYE